MIWSRSALLLPALFFANAGVLHAQPFFGLSLEKIDDPVIGGTAVWADFNADGNLDLLLTGRGAPEVIGGPDAVAGRLYRHLGILPTLEGRIHRVFEHSLKPGVWMSEAAWSDYDGDGDLDVFLCGARAISEPFDPIAGLYTFEGELPLRQGQAVDGVYGCSADWGDFDNDGDQDLVVIGAHARDSHSTRLFRNEAGVLREMQTTLPALAFGDARWADGDGDGDLDLALMGVGENGAFHTGFHRNDGSGGFSTAEGEFPQLAFGSLAWGDYDNDGDQDLLVAGTGVGPTLVNPETAVYSNDSEGSFSRLAYFVPGKYEGGAIWGDWNSDGLLDFVETGARPFQSPTADLHLNTGAQFERVENPCPVPPGTCQPLPGVALGAPVLFDVDNDDDLDLMLYGLDENGERYLRIQRNDTINIVLPQSFVTVRNQPPGAPSELSAEVTDAGVELSWLAAADDTTPVRGLTYNVRVGTAPGSVDVMPPMSIVATGRRQVVGPGNVGSDRRWHLELPPGTYYWSVQAIDHSFAGSRFADEASFLVR